MSKVSVIIPARKEPYLRETIKDLYDNAADDIEVILVLDGYKPDFRIPKRNGLVVMRNQSPQGMRKCINNATGIATGEYLMKIDAHCSIGEGWDEILKADCSDNWIIVPRRYWFDAVEWKILDRPYVDAMSYLYPFIYVYRPRLTCRPDERRQRMQKDDLVEDMGFQGSLWFMTAKHFKRLGGLNEYGYGTFSSEPEELGLKTQLGPWEGSVMRNKKTWYAHWSKPMSHWRADPEVAGRADDKERDAGWIYTFDYWWNNRWKDRAHDFEWLVDKFWPLPTWPDNWRWETKQFTRYEIEVPMVNM